MYGFDKLAWPKGERNGMWKHGGDTLESVALRREARKLMVAISAPTD